MYEGLGFIEDPISSNSSYLASSPYDISSVTIDERFNPLLGVEGTLNNGMTLKARYNSGRMLNLNIASYQIVESRNSEFVIGFEYRINDFNRVIGLG